MVIRIRPNASTTQVTSTQVCAIFSVGSAPLREIALRSLSSVWSIQSLRPQRWGHSPTRQRYGVRAALCRFGSPTQTLSPLFSALERRLRANSECITVYHAPCSTEPAEIVIGYPIQPSESPWV
jgi:hypothetical protein